MSQDADNFIQGGRVQRDPEQSFSECSIKE